MHTFTKQLICLDLLLFIFGVLFHLVFMFFRLMSAFLCLLFAPLSFIVNHFVSVLERCCKCSYLQTYKWLCPLKTGLNIQQLCFLCQAGGSESWIEDMVYVPAEGHGRPHPRQSPVLQTPPLTVCGAVCDRHWPGNTPPAVCSIWRQQYFTGYLRQHPAI